MKKAIAISGRLMFLLAILAETWFLRDMDLTVFSGKMFPLFNRYGLRLFLIGFISFLLIMLGLAWLFRLQNRSLNGSCFLRIVLKKVTIALILLRFATDIVVFLLALRPNAITQAATLLVEAASLTVSFILLRKTIAPQAPPISPKAHIAVFVGMCLTATMIVIYSFQFLAATQTIAAQVTVSDISYWVNQTNFSLKLTKLAFYGLTWITLFIRFGLFTQNKQFAECNIE